jgi:hypothetical protein
MKEGKVADWLKRAYPPLKEQSRLPAWILPEHSFARIADELGDGRILELSRPLGFAEGVKDLLKKAPDVVPVEAWQTVVMQWPPLVIVKPMIEACLEATAMVERHFQSHQATHPLTICRSMAVLGFAPFLPQGQSVMGELALILQGDRNCPAQLLRRYADAVVQGDVLTLRRVDDCIARHSQWLEWAGVFLEAAQSFPKPLKPVAVTPPLTAELAGVLADMIRERRDD